MNQDQYLQLLYKQLSGEIGKAEQQQLDDWLAKSVENRQIAGSVEKAWTMSDNYQPSDLPEIDTDADFALLEKRIAEAETSTPVRQLNPRRTPWVRIAVAAMIILVGGFVLRQWFSNNIQWETIATVTGEKKEIKLADGSKVWLNENTTLQVPTKFSGDLREVKLTGEAFFAVEKNPQQAFVVYTSSGTVRVLGTSFNVRDVSSESVMQVQVRTGKVQVDNNDQTAQVILIAGEQAQVDRSQNTVVKLDYPIDNALFWQTGLLVFNNQSLDKVLQELEAAYKVEIQLANKDMAKCLFTSTFKQKSIRYILNTIATVFGMELVDLNEKTFQLKEGRCQ